MERCRRRSAYWDGAYVSSEALKDASEQGRELRGPAPASPDRGKIYTVEAFDVHVEERYAICTAARRSSNCSRLEEESTGKLRYRIEWTNTLCAACPLRPKCVSSGQDHRTPITKPACHIHLTQSHSFSWTA